MSMRFFFLLTIIGYVRSDDPCLFTSKYGIIDLTTVGRSDGKPQFLNIVPSSGSNYQFSYNPCKSFTQGLQCQNVSVCQTSFDGQIQIPLGTQSSTKWDDGTHTGTGPSINYSIGQKQVHIWLICTQSPDGDLIAFGEETPNNFAFILRHPCACWNQCYVPPKTTTTMSTSTTEKTTTKTTTKQITTPTPTSITTTLPLDTAHNSMRGHICLTIVSILISLILF